MRTERVQRTEVKGSGNTDKTRVCGVWYDELDTTVEGMVQEANGFLILRTRRRDYFFEILCPPRATEIVISFEFIATVLSEVSGKKALQCTLQFFFM